MGACATRLADLLEPSFIVVVLMIGSIPVTALGGWLWAAQLTESKAGRALAGLGFAMSPVLLGSLQGGHLPTLVLTMVLPWLLIAATRARESWSWAGTASLLAAVALAAAPVLIPAALVLLVVGLFTSLRSIGRVLATAVVPLVLFAPKIVTSFVNGQPLDLLIDPGISLPFDPATPWHMLLGFPTFGLEGWASILDAVGLGGPPATLLVGVLMLPLALLALLGLFTGRVMVTVLSALLGGLGMLTTLASAQLHLTAVGSESVALWTGSGLAVYWLALLSLAAVGAGTLRRAAAPVVSVALVAALVAVFPVAGKLVVNDTPSVAEPLRCPHSCRPRGKVIPVCALWCLPPKTPTAFVLSSLLEQGCGSIKFAPRKPLPLKPPQTETLQTLWQASQASGVPRWTRCWTSNGSGTCCFAMAATMANGPNCRGSSISTVHSQAPVPPNRGCCGVW
ncbi:hypothetical protein [Leucobacter insecticola]|uniref:hypothetical protein n=1 Tax=Leucobacter insecticola TaxID=2714934 RepID=UPI001FCC9455|nr:hypothetical protein [Leucobacter insecticola]